MRRLDAVMCGYWAVVAGLWNAVVVMSIGLTAEEGVMERNWVRARAAAQDGLDNAQQEASDEAAALADMLARGVETTSAFAASEARYDELQRDAIRWRAIRDASAVSRG